MDAAFAPAIGFPRIADCGAIDAAALPDWVAANADSIESDLVQSGALLFRGADINGCDAFERFCRALTPKLRTYVGGGSPRTHIKGQVYTSTEYPAQAAIPLHCEASYLPGMPQRIWFYCQTPAAEGGETPIGDMAVMLERLEPAFVERIRRDGVLYVSNLHGGAGFGKSWMDTYESTCRDEVEARLAGQGSSYSWRPDGGLHVEMRAPATRTHSRSGEEIWVNQAINWHPAHLGEENYARLLSVFGAPQNFPKCAFYGDGEPIEARHVHVISAALKAIEVSFTWRAGDILLLDNERVAHGRRPFRGPRAVYVAMA